jgi:hypothetical protein
VYAATSGRHVPVAVAVRRSAKRYEKPLHAGLPPFQLSLIAIAWKRELPGSVTVPPAGAPFTRTCHVSAAPVFTITIR